MAKKDVFIKEIEDLMKQALDCQEMTFEGLSEDAMDFWNGLKITEPKKSGMTENGKLILRYMQENKDLHNNLFKAKDIGEGLEISSRTVSGAIRKLVSDNYVERLGESPIVYSLTTLGIATIIDN